MHRRSTLITWQALSGLLALSTLVSLTTAQDVRYFRENGVDYMETTQQVRTPVVTNRVESRQQTVYQEKFNTKVQEQKQTVYTPVVEYHWEPRVHNVLNPFRPNVVQYHLVPRTRWQPSVRTVKTPITYRTVTPQTQTVQVPVRELGFQTQNQVQRTALAPNAVPGGVDAGNRLAARPGGEHHHVAPQPAIGGVQALDDNPPRQGWQGSPDPTLQR